jgi:hypothetical protein
MTNKTSVCQYYKKISYSETILMILFNKKNLTKKLKKNSERKIETRMIQVNTPELMVSQ